MHITTRQTEQSIRPDGISFWAITKPLLVGGLLALLSGCDSNTGNDQLPADTSVKVSPDTIEWKIGLRDDPCLIDPNIYQDHMFSIMVLNSSGNAIGEAPLTITLDLSGNTFTGYPVLQLYDDLNGNGVIDGPSELVSSNTDAFYETETDLYTGEKILFVRVNLSCPYKGNLYAFANGYLGTMSIGVIEDEAAP